MIITPVNVSEITRSVYEILRDDPTIGGAGVLIERSGEIQKVPTVSGWVGIYRDSVSYPPRTLGLGTGYRNQLIRLFLLLHESDPTSGEECEDRLESLLQRVVSALLSNESLKGTVDTLDEFSVVQQSYDKQDNMFFQYARINFTGIIPVSAM